MSCLCQDLSYQTCFKDAQNQEQTLDWSACLDIDALVRSQMYKDEAGNWRCSGCDYFSKSSTSVSEHIESKHVYGPGFACHICQHVCPTRKALKMHIFRGKHYWYHLSWIKIIWSIKEFVFISSVQTWIRWSRQACRNWKVVNGSACLAALHRYEGTMWNITLKQSISIVEAFNAVTALQSVQRVKHLPCISCEGIRILSSNKMISFKLNLLFRSGWLNRTEYAEGLFRVVVLSSMWL